MHLSNDIFRVYIVQRSLKIHSIHQNVREHVDIHCAEQLCFLRIESNWIFEFCIVMVCASVCILLFDLFPTGTCDINSSMLSSLLKRQSIWQNKTNKKHTHSKCRHANERLYLNIWIWSEKVLVDIFLSIQSMAKTNKRCFNSFSMRLINYTLSLSFLCSIGV